MKTVYYIFIMNINYCTINHIIDIKYLYCGRHYNDIDALSFLYLVKN